MCCTLAKARLSNTILYAGEAKDIVDNDIHIMGYQNTVQDLSGALLKSHNHSSDWDYNRPLGSSGGGQGNAMILPVPAVSRSMGMGNFISTDKFPNILQDMAAALRPNANTFTAGVLRGAAPQKVEVFDIGPYTIVLATDASLIPGALSQVREDKRPKVNEKIFDAYDKFFPGWTFVFSCFSNKDAKTPPPILCYYYPKHPEFLFLPALDAHTGEVPELNARVAVDHAVVVSSHRMIGGDRVRYTNTLPNDVQNLLPPNIIGGRYNGTLPNGDFVCHLNDVHNGKFAPKRLLPPGVPRKNS